MTAMSSTHTTLHRRVIHFAGRVQGVGFRYTVKNIALPHSVQGYVRNLPDGRVELLMEGPDQEMDEIAGAIKQKMAGFIRKVDVNTSPATGEFEGFQIRH